MDFCVFQHPFDLTPAVTISRTDRHARSIAWKDVQFSTGGNERKTPVGVSVSPGVACPSSCSIEDCRISSPFAEKILFRIAHLHVGLDVPTRAQGRLYFQAIVQPKSATFFDVRIEGYTMEIQIGRVAGVGKEMYGVPAIL